MMPVIMTGITGIMNFFDELNIHKPRNSIFQPISGTAHYRFFFRFSEVRTSGASSPESGQSRLLKSAAA